MYDLCRVLRKEVNKCLLKNVSLLITRRVSLVRGTQDKDKNNSAYGCKHYK